MNPSVLLQATLKIFVIAALLVCGVAVLFGRALTGTPEQRRDEDVQRLLNAAWATYRDEFIGPQGQLKRPDRDYDSVAEGQANAMIRAVWLDDRETFNLLYVWAEKNLSRQGRFGDHLLAHLKGPDHTGAYVVTEWNAPTDANLDYALALFLAARRWGDEVSPPAVAPYREKALQVANDLLRKAVVNHPGTREMILLPWCRPELANEPTILLCPADFSPGHYRVFLQETNDPKWGRLIENTYAQLTRLLTSVDRVRGVGLAPDWVRMRPDGTFQFDNTHGMAAGVESFRLWWRLRIDWNLSREQRARAMLEDRLAEFIPKAIGDKDGRLAALLAFDGQAKANYENPGALGTLAWALDEVGPKSNSAASELRNRLLLPEHMTKQAGGGTIFFGQQKDYYVNTWAWWGLAQASWAFPFNRLEPVAPAATP